MTKLTKAVWRETNLDAASGKPILVGLVPPDKIVIRRRGERQVWCVPVRLALSWAVSWTLHRQAGGRLRRQTRR